MADVRSMLKSQRSARQVRHPHAVYSSKGQLSCSLCRVTLKSEAQWEQHIRSEQHAAVLKRAKSQASAEASDSGTSKKRKASEEEDESSKRIRSDSIPSRPRTAVEDTIPGKLEDDAADVAASEAADATVIEDAQAAGLPNVTDSRDDIDDEMAAFDREMAELAQEEQVRQQQQAPSALQAYRAAPAISAKPMTAAELAAQDREEKSAQRSARDVELEEEREEAAGQLQDEVERMNKLDEKIRGLRARKDALAQSRSAEPENAADAAAGDQNEPPPGDAQSESEDELDEWAFGK